MVYIFYQCVCSVGIKPTNFPEAEKSPNPPSPVTHVLLWHVTPPLSGPPSPLGENSSLLFSSVILYSVIYY